MACFQQVPLGTAEFFLSLACRGSFYPFPTQGAWIYSGPAQLFFYAPALYGGLSFVPVLLRAALCAPGPPWGTSFCPRSRPCPAGVLVCPSLCLPHSPSCPSISRFPPVPAWVFLLTRRCPIRAGTGEVAPRSPPKRNPVPGFGLRWCCGCGDGGDGINSHLALGTSLSLAFVPW